MNRKFDYSTLPEIHKYFFGLFLKRVWLLVVLWKGILKAVYPYKISVYIVSEFSELQILLYYCFLTYKIVYLNILNLGFILFLILRICTKTLCYTGRRDFDSKKSMIFSFNIYFTRSQSFFICKPVNEQKFVL